MNFKAMVMATISLAALAGAAQAQTLEEVVVTAQKRSENLQTVPLAVTAVSAARVAVAGIHTTEDLAVSLPGLTVNRTTTSTLLFVRGVGTAGGQAGQENAIATFIDGVYIPAMGGSTLSMNNIERIELLKGPQGTLYGRNATGGALNIVTRTPSYDPAVSAEIGYGNLDAWEGNFYATTGLSDKAAIDFAGYFIHQGKGFGRNQFNGDKVNRLEDLALRSKVLFEPSDDTRIVLAADYSKTGGNQGMSQRAHEDSVVLATGQKGNPYGFWDTNSDVHSRLSIKNWGGSARIEHDFGFAKLTSITAYRKMRGFQDGDLDLSPVPLLEYPITEANRNFTQELQLGGSQGTLTWIVGAFYLNGTAEYDPFTLRGLAFAPAQGIGHFAAMDTKSISAYGQATFEVLPDTNLTLGARYTNDRRSLDFQRFTTIGGSRVFAPAVSRPTEKFSKPTWRIALDHKLNEDAMVYGSYSRGFKSGVFNMTAPEDAPVNPETLDAFEVGLKTMSFDNRLRLNIAGYYSLYDEIQVSIIQGPAQHLLNAAKAKIYGLDVDFDVALAEGLNLHGGANWAHARYDRFIGAPITTPNPTGGSIIVAGDASGNHMVRTPTFTLNAAIDWRVPAFSGELAFNTSYQYNDGFYWEPDNRVRQGAYHLVNTQVKWTTASGRYHVRAFARNLLNDKYLAQVTYGDLGDNVSAAAGRTYGVSVGVDF